MTTAEKRDTPFANGQPVDLNGAGKNRAALPGIGPHYAQSIIDARPYGPSFGSKKDLLKKKLIPQETYDKIQSRVTANGPRNNLCLKGLNTEGVEQLPKARRL